MPIDPAAVKKWARGASSNAADEDELDNPGDEDEDQDLEGEEEEEEEGPRNELWSGEHERTDEELEELDEEESDELMDWLEENEPDIAEALGEIYDAIESGDEAAIEAATEKLNGAEQYLNPEYSPLTEGQRKIASENIRVHHHHGTKRHPGGRKQMIAIGLAQARRGEKE